MRPVLLVLAALLLGPAAQASDLKLATWNLNWLTLRPAGDPSLPPDVRPRGPKDFDLLRRYALALAADVIAFQEVDGSQSASRVFTPDRYDLYLTADEVVQRGLARVVRLGSPFWDHRIGRAGEHDRSRELLI